MDNSLHVMRLRNRRINKPDTVCTSKVNTPDTNNSITNDENTGGCGSIEITCSSVLVDYDSEDLADGNLEDNDLNHQSFEESENDSNLDEEESNEETLNEKETTNECDLISEMNKLALNDDESAWTMSTSCKGTFLFINFSTITIRY